MIQACNALELPRATAYRRMSPPTTKAEPTPRSSHRQIQEGERAQILDILDSERFVDQPPREVYATLLDEGQYLCSPRTMYRLLASRGEVRDRRDHRERGSYDVPRLTASAPNQVWTWDISKLATMTLGVFLNLYVILDLFSRFVVAWMVAQRENSALAKQMFAQAVSRYGIRAGELLVHQDRGAPMTAHGFTELLSQLGVDRSYSRPRVSNDNPYSESAFHTIKYQPDYPGRFRDIQHARQWCADFFAWYNDDHHHEGLHLFTPADVFFGRLDMIAPRRQQTLDRAFAAHPERFPKGPPTVRLPPKLVTLNPIDPEQPPIPAERILCARDEELAELWPPAPRTSTAPVIHLPGIVDPATGDVPAHPFPS